MPDSAASQQRSPIIVWVDALRTKATATQPTVALADAEHAATQLAMTVTTADPTALRPVESAESPDTDHGAPPVLRKRRRAVVGPGAALTVIEMRGGELPTIVDLAEATLLTGPATIFQRGTVLVHPVRVDVALGDAASPDVRRDGGSVVLIAVSAAWLREQMARSAVWVRRSEEGKLKAADPALTYPKTLIARLEWAFPRLRGIVTAPTLARDGRILETPGYDEASRLLLDFGPDAFPPMPPAPTRDDARAALKRIMHPLRGFPFVDPAAHSVALSAMLTSLVRIMLRTAPLHGFDAPTAGTGKSLLAEAVGLLGTGYRPPAMSQGKNPEEDEKRLSTVLFAGDPVIHLDNCERPVSGDFLCSMLTQEVVQARILGLSERRVLPSTPLVLASGNNLTFGGDPARRAVLCRLDAQVERPDTRPFDFDCHAEVLASRPHLVVAGLTILLAYRLAQQRGDGVTLTPMGSFSDWEWIRGALVWLDCADPADTRAAVLRNDPVRDDMVAVMGLWDQALGRDAVEVGEIARRASASRATDAAARSAVVELRDKLIEVTGKEEWSAKAVGWWLRRHVDRVVGGRAFQCADRDSQRHWWLA